MKADENRETIFQAVCDSFSKMYNSMNALKCLTKEHQIKAGKRTCATKYLMVLLLNLRGEMEVVLGLPNSWYFSKDSETFCKIIELLCMQLEKDV